MTDQPERAGYAGPWCTVCGSVAVHYLDTLDPRRPVAYCARGVAIDTRADLAELRASAVSLTTDRHGKPHGCGRVIGSYDRDEAERAYRDRRRRITESRHSRHDPDRPGKWASWCRQCEQAEQARARSGVNAAGTSPAGAVRKGF